MIRHLSDDELNGASCLPGWSLLTIVCHLRYGALALLRMTRDTLAGRATSYYPKGRAQQRPGTLEPDPGQCPAEVIDAFASASEDLYSTWRGLDAGDWSLAVMEPEDNIDLGTIPLARLAMSRLLEIDVHGTDLGIGFPDWSQLLIDVALPTRLAWLATRRTNHRSYDRTLHGSWLLVADPGLRWLVTVDGERTESRPAEPHDMPTATIRATSRDLLAILLGRPPREAITIDGDPTFGRSFSAAYPGP
jgi:hypothetical protein